jgi:lipopolysaccharide biosynthesis regulator YciM
VDAVRTDSNALDAYQALAHFYRDRGEVGRAIRVHQNLLLRQDLSGAERVSVLAELASDYRHGGFLARAVAAYEEVLVHDARHRGSLRALTGLYADLREYPKAIAAARRLERAEKRKDPKRDAALRAEMAEFEFEQGRGSAARKAAKAALKKDPECARAQIVLGQLEAERGRDKAALAAWCKVPAYDRERARDLYPRIEATFASLDRARDFEGFLRGLIDEDPADPGAVLALAGYLSARGDTEMALAELKGLLGRRPQDREARLLLGRILLEARREDEVVQEFANLLGLLEASPEPHVGESLE